MQHFDDVRGRRAVDHRGGNELVHGLVVGGVAWVVDEAGAADVDGAREEGHPEGLLVRDALEGTDEVGSFEVLGSVSTLKTIEEARKEGIPLTRESIGLEARRGYRILRMG